MPTKRNNTQQAPSGPTANKSDIATPQKTRVRARRPGESLTPDEIAKTKDTFLAQYAKVGNVAVACEKARIHRSTIHRWAEHDDEFAMRYEQAKNDYCDSLRNEISRRGRDGWIEPVYQEGRKVGSVRKYSDTLLIFQAKAHMPEYREKVQLEQSGKVTVQHDIPEDTEAAALARALIRRLTASGGAEPSGAGISGER